LFSASEISLEKQNQIFQGPNFSAEKFSQSSGRRPAESLKNLFCFSKKN